MLNRLLLALLLVAPAAVRAVTPEEAFSAKKSGDYPRAIALYETLLAQEPTNPEYYFQLGTAQGWAGRNADALLTLERGLALAPAHTDLRLAYGRVLAWSGNLTRAESVIQALVAEQPKNPGALGLLGVIQGFEKHYPEAIGSLEQALLLAPTDSELRLNLGRVLGWSGNFGRAAEVVAALVAEQPANLEALNLLGRVLIWQHRFDAAEQTFNQVLAVAPSNTDALLGQGDVQKFQERYDEARRYYEQAQRTDPESAKVKQSLASVHRAGRWRLDVGGGYATYTGDSTQSDWQGWDAALRYAVDKRTGVSLAAAWARRYHLTDEQYTLGLDRRLTDDLFGYARASVTPQADFFAQQLYAAGGEWRIHPASERLAATVLLADVRAATYAPGTAYSCWLGVTQYTKRRVAVTARYLISRNLNEHWTNGWQVRLDGEPTERWRWQVGYSDSKESLSSTIVDYVRELRNCAVFAGVYREFTPSFGVRLDLSHEWSPGTYGRNNLHVGIVTRF
jgi:YaiO family outer membrane protein